MQVGSLSANRNLIVGAIIFIELALAVGYYIQYYKPAVDNLVMLNATVEKKSRDVREIENTKRMLGDKQKEIERLKTDIARLERYFPEEVFIPRVLVLLENLAQATHLKIDSIKPGMQGVASKPGMPSAAGTAAQRPATTPSAAATPRQPPGSPRLSHRLPVQQRRGPARERAHPPLSLIRQENIKPSMWTLMSSAHSRI